MLSPEQLQLLPLILLLGLMGGLVRTLTSGKVYMPAFRRDEDERLYFDPGSLKELFVGVAAAFVVWGVGEVMDLTPGALATALLSGYGGVYVLNKFSEVPEEKTADKLARENDILNKRVEREVRQRMQIELAKHNLELDDIESDELSLDEISEVTDDTQQS